MKFGIREVCNVVFRAKTKQTLGSRTFLKGEPVLYFDTLKTSSLEGASTTVYAQGGQGNPQLIGWDGERTLTFTMEDALLSMEGLSILTGAGLIAADKANSGKGIFKHEHNNFEVKTPNTIVIEGDFVCWTDYAAKGENFDDDDILESHKNGEADIFVMTLDDSGNINAEPCIPSKVEYSVKEENGKKIPVTTITCYGHDGYIAPESIVLVDYYILRTSKATQVEITADKFSGSYYIEADTLFRRQGDNYDMPAAFVIPNGKIQSNFNFAMANSGDPSTFTFTVDAMPDYTKFDRTHKVLAMLQVIEDEDEEEEEVRVPCSPRPVDTDAIGATIKTIADTDSAAEVEITGNKVRENASTNSLFNGPLLTEDAMVASVHVKTKESSCVIRQTNPALSMYESDTYVKDGVKTRVYGKLDDDYEFLVTEGNNTITIEVFDGVSTTIDLDDETPTKTYTIKTNVKFA